MTNFDQTPPAPPEPNPPVASPEGSQSTDELVPTLAGDPLSYAAEAAPQPCYGQNPEIPDDLRISWSWPHLILFVFFAGASFIVVQTALFIYYSPGHPLPQAELERYLLNKPQFIFGTNLLWYASVFFFLYITLSVLRDSPFWASLGWKKLKASVSARSGPWSYFLGGCALAIFVGLASSQIHTKENMPIQQLFKNRSNAVLLMGMAVLVAPLVEETVFRGYLYPLLARIAYATARHFGVDPARAVRVGVRTSVLLTGLLFGLMHGSQLGWSWEVVALLVLVGVIFTLVRACTGTVLASFLLHLGYNSMIALTTIVGTHGFTRIPTSP
jgi:membrane protease YdiL (CAAX protease family)